MASERAETTAVGTAPVAEEASGVRVALSPYLFRGTLVGMAAVAVALHRATGNRDLAWRFAKARARTLTWMLGVDVRVCGLEQLAGGGPFVFAPNHQSHLDILVLLGFLPGRTRFAAKKELWAHPVVGAVLDTLGMVPIDRDHPERAIDALDRAAAERHSFVIFPEGTRSRTGQLLPFKKGAFVLAIAAGLPIVPVVCRRTPPHAGLPGSRTRALKVEVWYPAAPGPTAPARDAPLAASGPFPLVVNSPGLLDSRGGELYYTAHLAGRGFVVASIDFPLTRGSAPGGPDLADFHNQPGDVRFVIDQLLRLSHRRGPWLAPGGGGAGRPLARVAL